MPMLIRLCLAACLLLPGCGIFRRSDSWVAVQTVRVDTRFESDPSGAYATQLSERLMAGGVEHKVVTYSFRYRTRLREEAIGTRTAVVYRDDVHPKYPWWIMDERLGTPVWLPNTSIEDQVAFYCRDDVEIVEETDFPAGADGKKMMPGNAAASGSRQIASGISASENERPVARKSGPNWFHSVMRLRRSARPTRLASMPRNHEDSGALASLFLACHGSSFDPASPNDRRKMNALRAARVF